MAGQQRQDGGGANAPSLTVRRPLPLGEMLIALGVLVLAGVVFWQTTVIPVSPLYAKVGPTAIPYVAAGGLLLLGAALLWQAVRGGWQDEEEASVRPDRLALGWVLAGLALNVLLIDTAGFTIASVVMFACVARGFGSRKLVRDVLIGLSFALIAYLGFAKTLGINIGAGFLERAIDSALSIGGL